MQVRDARGEDRDALVRLRSALWPGADSDDAAELDAYFAGASRCIDRIIVCEVEEARLAGFAEVRVRNYAEGSDRQAVPYLEGWFVEARYRRQGIGARLIAAAEHWARSMGYHELASDSDIGNHDSIAAHAALGFAEVERVVCFLKKL